MRNCRHVWFASGWNVIPLGVIRRHPTYFCT